MESEQANDVASGVTGAGSAVEAAAPVAGDDSGAAAEIAPTGTYVANADGTVTINGKTYAVEEVDPVVAPTPENPAECPDCGGTFEKHEIVLGRCQPCNTKAQEAERSKGSMILAAVEKLLDGK